MTNQIPEDAKDKIESYVYKAPPEIQSVMRKDIEFGYTLGLQSAEGEVDKLYKQRDALLNSKKILEEDNERKDKLLQSADKRVKELEDGLRDLIYTASKLWDDNKPLEDTDTMKITHPIIEEAKQLLSK